VSVINERHGWQCRYRKPIRWRDFCSIWSCVVFSEVFVFSRYLRLSCVDTVCGVLIRTATMTSRLIHLRTAAEMTSVSLASTTHALTVLLVTWHPPAVALYRDIRFCPLSVWTPLSLFGLPDCQASELNWSCP